MYVPLRVYSPFSIGFGAVRLEQLADFCATHGLPAAAVTDRDCLGGAMTAAKTLAARGIQPITGATFTVTAPAEPAADTAVPGSLVLIATSQAGYRALLRVANHRNLQEAPAPTPIETVAQLLGPDAGDVIALTGGRGGLIAQLLETRAETAAEAAAARLAEIFADSLYIELNRDTDAPAAHEAALRGIAQRYALPLVATEEAHYPDAGMTVAHDAFLCIAGKTYLAESARRQAEPGRHLVDPETMEARFADLPEAIANSGEIARRATFLLEPETPRLPAFPTAAGESEESLLRRQARDGLAARLETLGADGRAAPADAYTARLDYELDVIAQMGYPGYFLIVADFIGWARDRTIPVGPGRGSGAGSLVAWALGITDIDPLAFGLLFERFLNPERVSMPDFDIDFAQERRDEVIEYVRGKYGADRVAHIATFGTLQARAVVRDTARVMQIPYPVADRFARMIPQNPANPVTLEEAMADGALAEELAQADADIRQLFATALKLEGLYRHVSTHAAGLIISDRPVAEVVPVHRDHHGKLATSFEMKAVEAAGLVKFDFLGLKNLDIIQGTLDFVAADQGAAPDLERLGFADPETFAQLGRGDGFSVFQLESAGMRQAMRDLGVGTIEELIALISLYRPGPMDQIRAYADVKHGRSAARYAHPEMEDILAPTNGVMIYQEQVMELARRLAGYSPGDADLLRRAMGKKIAAEMDAQRERFESGAAAGWVDIALESGETRRVHARTQCAALDGTGRRVSIATAIAEGIEVAV